MNTWIDAVRRIESIDATTPSLVSNKGDLLDICRGLEEIGFSPDGIVMASTSSLRAVVRPLRIATFERDIKTIEQIFCDLIDLSYQDVRMKYKWHPSQEIIIRKNGDEVSLKMSEDQFNRVVRRLAGVFSVVVTE